MSGDTEPALWKHFEADADARVAQYAQRRGAREFYFRLLKAEHTSTFRFTARSDRSGRFPLLPPLDKPLPKRLCAVAVEGYPCGMNG